MRIGINADLVLQLLLYTYKRKTELYIWNLFASSIVVKATKRGNGIVF